MAASNGKWWQIVASGDKWWQIVANSGKWWKLRLYIVRSDLKLIVAQLINFDSIKQLALKIDNHHIF